MLQYILVMSMASVVSLGVGDVGLRGLSNLWGLQGSNSEYSELSMSELQRYARRGGLSRNSLQVDDAEQKFQTAQQASDARLVAREMLARGFDQIRQQLKRHTITVAAVCVSLLLLAACSLRGSGKLDKTMHAKSWHSAEPFSHDKVGASIKPQRLSIISMMILTCFKFYVGFLSATWMPFLMAKEGIAIFPDRQSVFMGAGKLIYGTSILLNPVFGLISDQTVFAPRWSGRGLWLIIGVFISAIGITLVKAASSFEDPTSFLVATALWMLGEAIADTTSETLVPEMVPSEQYDVVSGIRSLMFLCGGLCGYISLIVFRGWDFHWIYSAYLLLLFCCAFPTVASIRAEQQGRRPVSEQRHILNSIVEAYTGVPKNKYGPDFGLACAIQFVFSLGSASIFFTMLMTRDLCGLPDETSQQTHFSTVSMLFMLAAAISSVVAAWLAEKMKKKQCGFHLSRKVLLLSSMVVFGLATLMLPMTYHFPQLNHRLFWFYFTGFLLGWAFGSVYALFQSCMWTLLPAHTSDVANAMGFAALCKCVGIGLGNFAAGFILDSFSLGPREYAIGGYWSMAVTCSVLVLVSAALGYCVKGID